MEQAWFWAIPDGAELQEGECCGLERLFSVRKLNR